MDSLEKKLVLCLVMALAIAIFIPIYWVREPARQAEAMVKVLEQNGNPQKGGPLFQDICSFCHGQEAEGAVGPALRELDSSIIEIAVRSGPGIMPTFGTAQISDQQLKDIIAFINSLNYQGN